MIGLSLTFRAVRLAMLVVSIPSRIRKAWHDRCAAEEERRRARVQAVCERLARSVSVPTRLDADQAASLRAAVEQAQAAGFTLRTPEEIAGTLGIELPPPDCAHLTRSAITGGCMHCGAPPVHIVPVEHYAPPGTAKTLCGRELHSEVCDPGEVGISWPYDPEAKTYYSGKPDRATCPACREAMQDGAPIAPREVCKGPHPWEEAYESGGAFVCGRCGEDMGKVDAGGAA